MVDRNDANDEHPTKTSHTNKNKKLLNRRSYLKAANMAMVAAAGIGVSGTASASSEYETITVGAGERRTIRVGSGETFEDKLIDITADNADVRVIADGSGWTIRNVGFRGSADVGNDQGGSPSLILVSGDGTVENVYFGDGVSRSEMRKGAVGIPQGHSGHIEFSNLHVAGYPGTPLYAATPSEGGGGTIAVNDSYFCNNNISHIRIAADGSTMDNCVIHNTNEVPAHPVNDGTVNSRGIYTGYGDPALEVTVRNSHVDVTDRNTNGAASALVSGTGVSTLRVVDSEIRGAVIGENVEQENCGNSPDTTPPDGVPMNPEEAASGITDSTDSNDGSETIAESLPHTLTLRGTGQATNYEFSVDGELQPNPEVGDLQSWDEIDGTTANGWVSDTTNVDSYQFSGTVTDFAFLQGEAEILLNGDAISKDDLTSGSDTPKTRTLSIEGVGQMAQYLFSVDGGIQPDSSDDDLDAWDEIDGSTASGWVAARDHVDRYSITGDITEFSLRFGEANISIDGNEVTPSELV